MRRAAGGSGWRRGSKQRHVCAALLASAAALLWSGLCCPRALRPSGGGGGGTPLGLSRAPRALAHSPSARLLALGGSAGDDEARSRGTQKSVLERKAPPTFPLVIEMRERAYWVAHWVEDSVDCLLTGKVPIVQARKGGEAAGAGRGPAPCLQPGLWWCWYAGSCGST